MKPTAHRHSPKRITLKKHESIMNVMEQRIKYLEDKNNTQSSLLLERAKHISRLTQELERANKIIDKLTQ